MELEGRIAFVGCQMPDMPVSLGANASLAMVGTLVGEEVVNMQLSSKSTMGERSVVASTFDQSVASIERIAPTSGTDAVNEQRAYLKLLAAHYSATTGRDHFVKHEETQGCGVDGDPSVDGILCIGEGAESINVQVEHVSFEMAARLGRTGAASAVAVTRDTVQEAINAKESDSSRSGKELLLICPVDVGEPMANALQTAPVDSKGYRRVWLCGPSGPPVQVAEA